MLSLTRINNNKIQKKSKVFFSTLFTVHQSKSPMFSVCRTTHYTKIFFSQKRFIMSSCCNIGTSFLNFKRKRAAWTISPYKYSIRNYSALTRITFVKPLQKKILTYKTITRSMIYSCFSKKHHAFLGNKKCYYIPKRTIMSTLSNTFKKAGSLMKNSSLVSQNSQKVLLNSYDKKPFKVEAGKVKPMVEKIQPSTQSPSDDSVPIQSELSGKHKIACVTTCKQNLCPKRLCDTIHHDICPHKKGDGTGIVEIAGALTHGTPLDKDVVTLSLEDAKGETKNGPQMIVTEKTVIPLNENDLKVHQGTTDYVQQQEIAEKIARSLPKNSVYHLKDAVSNCDTPYDENF